MDERKHERFGRYEILTELGRGAMGIVYKAWDPKINRVVAVKTFSLAGQPPEEEQEYRERFFREAEAAGRLSHPGIVTVFDVGEEPETRAPYIVMEFVAGQSLDKLLLSRDDRKLPADAALKIALELAEALDCAHGLGVVHRDLKPANILLTEDGRAKIADFGIAKLNLSNNATQTGRTLGTPAYMSPEQLNDEPVDGRSDLFSLGVILYTLLTGYRPFQGNSAMTVAFKVVNREPIPATILDTKLPPGLDYIISRAIAKDPSQRYQRGMEIVLDIQGLREGREPWSKAKHPDSAPGATQEQSAKPSPSALITQLTGGFKPQSTSNVRSVERGARVLLDLRKKLLVAVLLLFGLLIFGMRTGMPTRYFGWPQQTSSPKAVTAQAAPPSLAATDAALLKPAAPPAAAKLRNSILRSHPDSKKPAAKSPAAPAMLEIEVDHKFAEAHLAIWVDQELTYTHPLQGVDRKHLVVFHHVQGHEFHAVQIPPGKHLLLVQVSPGAGASEQSGTVEGEFAGGSEKMLRILFSKGGEMNLTLE